MSGVATMTKSQVDRNFEAFQAKLPELLPTHAGKLALMHDGDIVDFFDSYADAIRFGQERFGEISAFSGQEVSNKTASLGYYSDVGSVQQYTDRAHA